MLDFSRQYGPLRQQILDAIAQVCDSQRFILGAQVADFEAAAAAACAVPFAVGCASGTDALWLALAAVISDGTRFGSAAPDSPKDLGIAAEVRAVAGNPLKSPGVPSVITTPFSFFATASAILRAGARPLFADIDPRTFNLSPAAVGEVLDGPEGNSVRAILPVHLYGQCADFDGLNALRRNHPQMSLLEDAAQAFGAAWNGAPAGSLGDAAAFSFYPTKNLAAFGDAGMVTTISPQIDRRTRSLRAHGMTRRYFHDEVGGNSRLDELQAAVLNVKLQHVAQWNRHRRERAAFYDQLFCEAGLAVEWPVASSATNDTNSIYTKDGIVLPYTDPRATHVFHQYVIRAPRRDALREHLTARRIGSEIYYPVPIHLQAALKGLGHKPGDFPHAERAAAEVLALPLYPELRDDEQQTVVEAIREFYA